MSQRSSPAQGEVPFASGAAPDEDAFLEAASRADARMAEVASAIVALNAENAAFRDEVEARLSERFERVRDRVLLSSTQMLVALDRSLEAARAHGGEAPLVAEAMRVRTQLSGLLRDEQGRPPAPRPGVETLAEPAAAVEEPIEVYEVDSEADPQATLVDMPANATLVVDDPEAVQSLLVRPAPAPARPHLALVPRRPPAPRPGVRGLAVGLSVVVALAAVAGVRPWLTRPPAPPEVPRRVSPPPSPPIEDDGITVVPPRRPDADSTASPGVAVATAGPEPIAAKRPGLPPISAPSPAEPPLAVPPPVLNPPVVKTVPDLLAEASQAMESKDYDTAIARYGQVLALDGANADARAATLRARGERAALGRFFLTQATIRDVPQDSGPKCKGPWGDIPCHGPRVYDCKLEYAITPATPVQGEPYRIEVTAVNTGEKGFKVQSLTAIVYVNGEQAPHPIASLEKDVARGERKVVGRLGDVWKAGTTSWWLEAAVKDQKGDSYRAQFTWELKTPSR